MPDGTTVPKQRYHRSHISKALTRQKAIYFLNHYFVCVILSCKDNKKKEKVNSE
jgi:hypothetical protein